MTELPDPIPARYRVRIVERNPVSPEEVMGDAALRSLLKISEPNTDPAVEVVAGDGSWVRVRNWHDVLVATATTLPQASPRAPTPAPISPVEYLAAPLQERNARLARCLGFFASVIKSGEPWTPTCQAMYDEARSLEPLQSEAWSPFLKPVHDAVDALNLALVAAGRAGLTMEVFNGQFSSGPEPAVPHVTAVASRLCPPARPS